MCYGTVSLHDRIPTVDGKDGSGYIIGGGACQEDGRALQFFGLAPAPGGYTAANHIVPLRLASRDGGGQLGHEPTRQYGVGLNVVLGPGHRQALGELHYAALAG